MNQPSTQVSSSKIVMALLQNSVPSATGLETGSVYTVLQSQQRLSPHFDLFF